MRKWRKDAGQAIVVVALGMVVILGFLGLGVDLGYLRYTKQRLQMVADAAALAGAMEGSYCAGTSNCGALTTAAQDALTENGFTGSTLVKNCGSSAGTLTVTVNNPPCALGVNDPHHGDSKYVEAVVVQSTPVFFARILGYSSVAVTARGEAALGSSTNCLYSLSPSNSNALSVTNGSMLTLPSCSMYIDSSSSQAVVVSGGSSISASSINIVGGYSNTGGSQISPTPATGVGASSDPLGYLTEPTIGTCVNSVIPYALHNATQTIPQGTYCGGIQITNGSTITFGPGTYVLEGGGLTINGGSTVTGSNVTFFLTGTTTYPYGPVNISNGANVQLIAPTSGTYGGILFYQDSSAYGVSSSSPSSFTGGTSSFFQGSLYFPNTSLVYSGGATAQYTIIVAASVKISGGVTLNSDYSSLSGGSPIKGTGAALVE